MKSIAWSGGLRYDPTNVAHLLDEEWIGGQLEVLA